MKIAVFWDLRLCSLIALMMEAVSTSEMSVNFYETARCNIPEESHLVLTCFNRKALSVDAEHITGVLSSHTTC
jgi:hypothetical protein